VKVTIRILDYGSKDSRPALTRYARQATAEYPDGVVREAVGNHGYTIMEAVTNVHWNGLDR